MNRKSVTTFIDRKIHQSLTDGFPIMSVQSDINIRCKNMTKTLLNEMKNVDLRLSLEDVLSGDIENLDIPIGGARLKYTAFYISHASKRISDLDWVISNKDKFKNFSMAQIFNLIKLKEKLS